MTRENLKPFSIWRHKATQSLYVVLGVAMCSTNGEREHREESVIYWSVTHQGLRYREVAEFLDGRFQLLHDRPDPVIQGAHIPPLVDLPDCPF